LIRGGKIIDINIALKKLSDKHTVLFT